jgi:hypothetical protein
LVGNNVITRAHESCRPFLAVLRRYENRKRDQRDAMLLALKLEEIALSQGMEAACRN